MRVLYPHELYKYQWRVNLFLEKFKNNSPFEMIDGTFVSFVYSDYVFDRIKNKDVKNLTFKDINGFDYHFKQIAKNKEFGGGDNHLSIEQNQQIQLSNKIKEFGSISVKLNNTQYKVIDCVNTKGYPKSDFHLIDENGEPVVWMSHKNGYAPQDFQQWSGMSKREPNINSHEETQQFIYDVQKLFNNEIPKKTSVFRKIKDEKLKKTAVYGNDFGMEYGKQNVNVVLQGDVTLKESGEIKANHILENGTPVLGDFEPVFCAVYKGDRNDFNVKGARFSILPKKSRKMTLKI